MLTSIGVRELPELQVDDNEAAQSPMKEQEVYTVPLIADTKPTLPPDERKVAAQLKQERFELPDERGLEIRLRVFILEVEKLEDVRFLDLFFRRYQVLGLGDNALAQHGRLVP